jgi:hypothetical protein
MRCEYETTETSPGRCDGGFQCTETAVAPCEACGGEFGPLHLRVCPDCGKQFCYAPMEGRCWGNHAHDPVKIPPQPETIHERVTRVCG